MASASTPKNRIVRTINQNAIFEDATYVSSASTTFNQGDLLVFDTTTKIIRTATSGGEATDSANFLGIAICTVSAGVPVGPYAGLATTTREAIGHFPGPVYGVEAALQLHSGDGLASGGLVYMKPSDSPWGVSSAGTNAIGVYNGPAITGDGIKTVNVHLGCRYPANVLLF